MNTYLKGKNMKIELATKQDIDNCENGNSVVYYFKDATAVISAFSHAPKIIKF